MFKAIRKPEKRPFQYASAVSKVSSIGSLSWGGEQVNCYPTKNEFCWFLFVNGFLHTLVRRYVLSETIKINVEKVKDNA